MKLLNDANIIHDENLGLMDEDYAEMLCQAEYSLLWILDRKTNRFIDIDGDGSLCSDCQVTFYYNPPQPSGYKNWVWIEVKTKKDCNVWIHLDYKSDQHIWAWAVWMDKPFPGSHYRKSYCMPRDFQTGPVYKTLNRTNSIIVIEKELCSAMKDICNCYGII